jgi:hypothetical protein
MAFSPLAASCYLNLYGDLVALAVAASVGAVLALFAVVVCRGRGEHEVPTLTFGSR